MVQTLNWESSFVVRRLVIWMSCTEAAILAWLEDRAATEEGQEIGAAARCQNGAEAIKIWAEAIYSSPESLDI